MKISYISGLWIFTVVLLPWLLPAAVLAQSETTRVSVSSSGMEGNNSVEWYHDISWDGRYAVFCSAADNLIGNDTNGKMDIFVRDRLAGQTWRASVASGGVEANNASFNPVVSAHGRYVVFASLANNLVNGDTNFKIDVFMHDGLTCQTFRVSVDSACGQADDDSDMPAISSDGRIVAFQSDAANLVPGDTNNVRDIFVHDNLTGQTTRVSVDSAGGQGDGRSEYPSVSGDGRFVAFQSDAANLVPGDTNGKTDIFVHDLLTGQTTRASVDSAGIESNGYSGFADLSGDGRFVTFDSTASNLVPGDTNNCHDIFVHDRLTGQTTRVSVDSTGKQASQWSQYPAINPDGRFVAFHSGAYNLVPGDTNNCHDVFVHDRLTGQTIRVSVDSAGVEANDQSSFPEISADGRHVVFQSWASNLVPGDTNKVKDTFVNSRLSLWTDTQTLPETGGTVNFFLDAWDSQAGRSYLILGSITGTAPGTPLPGGMATLPLNWDLFTQIVLALLNTPVFTDFMGNLDASGTASAQLNVPAIQGSAGMMMYYAYALNNPWNFVSNSVAVEIVP